MSSSPRDDKGQNGSDAAPVVAHPEMPTPAGEALRLALEAGKTSQYLAFMDALTSQAYVDLLKIFPVVGNVRIDDFEIESEGGEGDGLELFRVRLRTQGREIVASATLSQVKNAWLISSVNLLSESRAGSGPNK